MTRDEGLYTHVLEPPQMGTKPDPQMDNVQRDFRAFSLFVCFGMRQPYLDVVKARNVSPFYILSHVPGLVFYRSALTAFMEWLPLQDSGPPTLYQVPGEPSCCG